MSNSPTTQRPSNEQLEGILRHYQNVTNLLEKGRFPKDFKKHRQVAISFMHGLLDHFHAELEKSAPNAE